MKLKHLPYPPGWGRISDSGPAEWTLPEVGGPRSGKGRALGEEGRFPLLDFPV